MGWDSALAPEVKSAPAKTRQAAFPPLQIDLKRVVTLDFETYWDADYTLTKLTTSAYIRDPRFKVHLMGIKVGHGETYDVQLPEIQKVLNRIDWSTHAVLCHNTAFDGFILTQRCGIKPHLYLDTLSMARGVHSSELHAGGSLAKLAEHYN